MKWRILNIVLLISIGSFAQSKNVEVLDVWADPNMKEWYGDQAFNEVWGFVQDGQEYAVIGSANGTSVCLIHEDNTLENVEFVEGRHTDAIHRDYHDYNGYLYEVCDQGSSSLRVFDLQYLPDSLHLVFDDSTDIITAHNIFIDSSSALLYACGVKNSLTDDAMKVFSLSQPEIPTLVYNYNFVDYVHDVFVRNDTAYVNAANEGLRVVDFSTPTMPIEIGSLSFYVEQGYNHSGWLSEDGKTYVMCDETAGSPFKILDVSDLNNIEVINYTKPQTFEQTMPHNVMFVDGLAYFSYYADGLQIYDVRNPDKLKQLAYYDSFQGEDVVFKGAWGVYTYLPSKRILLSDRTSGLFLLKFDAPPNLVDADFEMQVYPNPSSEGYVYFYGDFPSNPEYQVDVFDALGKHVATYQGNSDYLKIEVQNWANGMYFFSATGNQISDKATGKFMVNN